MRNHVFFAFVIQLEKKTPLKFVNLKIVSLNRVIPGKSLPQQVPNTPFNPFITSHDKTLSFTNHNSYFSTFPPFFVLFFADFFQIFA